MSEKQQPPQNVSKETIVVGDLQFPQKVYRLRGSEKSFLLLSMFLAIPLIVASMIAGLIPDGMGVSAKVSFVAVAVLSVVVLGSVFVRVCNQRLEFSVDGITLSYFFYRIYAPWINIVGYDKNVQYPLSAHHSYGGFVYKEPALLYVPLRRGKEEQRTVVQIPRLRAHSNPELVAYLSHYLPILPEMFPEKDLPLLLSLEVTDRKQL